MFNNRIGRSNSPNIGNPYHPQAAGGSAASPFAGPQQARSPSTSSRPSGIANKLIKKAQYGFDKLNNFDNRISNPLGGMVNDVDQPQPSLHPEFLARFSQSHPDQRGAVIEGYAEHLRTQMPENDRVPLWNTLVQFTNQNSGHLSPQAYAGAVESLSRHMGTMFLQPEASEQVGLLGEMVDRVKPEFVHQPIRTMLHESRALPPDTMRDIFVELSDNIDKMPPGEHQAQLTNTFATFIRQMPVQHQPAAWARVVDSVADQVSRQPGSSDPVRNKTIVQLAGMSELGPYAAEQYDVLADLIDGGKNPAMCLPQQEFDAARCAMVDAISKVPPGAKLAVFQEWETRPTPPERRSTEGEMRFLSKMIRVADTLPKSDSQKSLAVRQDAVLGLWMRSLGVVNLRPGDELPSDPAEGEKLAGTMKDPIAALAENPSLLMHEDGYPALATFADLCQALPVQERQAIANTMRANTFTSRNKLVGLDATEKNLVRQNVGALIKAIETPTPQDAEQAG